MCHSPDPIMVAGDRNGKWTNQQGGWGQHKGDDWTQAQGSDDWADGGKHGGKRYRSDGSSDGFMSKGNGKQRRAGKGSIRLEGKGTGQGSRAGSSKDGANGAKAKSSDWPNNSEWDSEWDEWWSNNSWEDGNDGKKWDDDYKRWIDEWTERNE